MTESRIRGPRSRDLADEISDAIHKAMVRGLDCDEAVCVAAAVIADYARRAYGNKYLDQLATVVKRRAEFQMPQDIGDGGTA